MPKGQTIYYYPDQPLQSDECWKSGFPVFVEQVVSGVKNNFMIILSTKRERAETESFRSARYNNIYMGKGLLLLLAFTGGQSFPAITISPFFFLNASLMSI